MTVIMTEERSAEVDDFLAHYGVKGMRWGHRKAPEGKPELNVAKRTGLRLKVAAKGYGTYATNTKAALTVGKNRGAARQAARDKRIDFLNNPDRVTAATLTRGEKWAVAILSVNPVSAVIAIKGQNAVANRIEYQQKTGGYYKPGEKKPK